MRLYYKLFSEPLHLFAKKLLLNSEVYLDLPLLTPDRRRQLEPPSLLPPSFLRPNLLPPHLLPPRLLPRHLLPLFPAPPLLLPPFPPLQTLVLVLLLQMRLYL